MDTMWRVLLSYFLSVTVIVIIIHYYKNYLKSVIVAFKLPGPPALPIFGHVFLIRDNERMLQMSNCMSSLYGPIVKFWMSFVPIFMITEPSHLQVLLSTSKYSTKNMFYSFLDNLLGPGLVTLTGEKWKLHRRLIQPYFQINVLKVFFNVFHKYSSQLVHEFKSDTDVNIVSFANKFVLNVMHDAVFGIPVKTEKEFSLFRSSKVSVINRACKPWLLFNTLFNMTQASKEEIEHKNSIQDYTRRLMELKKRKTVNEQPDNTSVLDMMMEISNNNSQFTEKDVIDETASFILVGQDSVATALAFTLYFLAKHQDVQAKVVEELNHIYRANDHLETFEDTVEMKYLEQCIKESLRLCPSLPILARTITKEVSLGKHTFPPGTNIFISPFVTHRLPHIFPNPLEFNPDRFAPENKAKMHPFAFIPFSVGPRNCIGYKFALLELKIVISHILRNYHISLTPGHEDLNLIYSITLKAKGGIWLRFRQREAKEKNL